MDKNIEQQVINLYRDGVSISKIAKKIKISRQGIYNILNRNKINYKKQKANIDIDQIKNDLKYNKIKYVMKKYNLPYSRVRKIIEDENIKKYEIMTDVLIVEDIRRLYCDVGMTDEEIGKIFNCSQYTVRSFRWKNNIYDKNRQWQRELTKSKFLQMRADNKTLKQISEETGFPYHIVIKAKKIYEQEKILDN